MAEDAGRRIEEVIVTAERREASVSDTSLSISAFDAGFIADFGLRNQEDLQNYIPATTIQPYDITVRGVGRTARTLGGDPGVSTYFNGVYSEDFGIASTEGGLFDLERIEVLRGPQGTLYGRNAVGGAVNFISKRPTDELEVEAVTTAGNYGTFEFSGIASGPIIDDLLRARLTYTHRERDGYIKDTSPFGTDINDYGDDNIALALELTPTENLTFYVRANSRDYDRKFNGGSGTSPIVVSQAGGFTRDTTTLAFGWRPALAGETPQRIFTNPATGVPLGAVRIRPGVDQNAALNDLGVRDTTSATSTIPNYAYGFPQDRAHMTDVTNRRANGLKVDTNGQYEELFDHQAVQFVANWDVSEQLALQYTFGYTDFLYERNTDEDKTGNTLLGSYDFYVNQENYNWQHELQVMFDVGDSVSVTTGVFMYQSMIDQRLDLYDPLDPQGRFQDPAQMGAYSAAAFGTFLPIFLPDNGVDSIGVAGPTDIRSAQVAYEAGTTLRPDGTVSLIGPWLGDVGSALRAGQVTDGTFFAWDNTIKTRAYAAFGQGTWDINEKWALTLGLRYAKDKKEAQERLLTILEIPGFTALTTLDAATGFTTPAAASIPGFLACPEGNYLCVMNVTNGALDAATLNPASFAPGSAPIRFNAAPFSFVSYMPLKDDWDVWTWRANLDYTPVEGHLFYLSATTGWKSGGYNLGFRSTNNPVYEPEEVLAFELGYKGRLLNDTMQLNGSVYNYIYDNRQSFTTVLGQFGTGAAILNVPEQAVYGAEADVLWLATDQLTLGANASYTSAEFDSDLLSINADDPSMPGTLFTPQDRTRNVKGNKMPYIPEVKFTAWGSYAWNLGSRGTVELRSTASWTDEFYTTIYQSDLDKAHDFWRWDARLAWMSADGQWDISAFVNNITNELGVRQQDNFGELAGDYLKTVTTTDPRVYGMTLRWSLAGR
ncbi:MAG: TonB-dependent receptor [Pseudomonadales bacterium]|nr:TonB-dependent receptor [Pseudomonadales bacterium]